MNELLKTMNDHNIYNEVLINFKLFENYFFIFFVKHLKSMKPVKNKTLCNVPLNGFLEPAVTNSWLPYPQTALQPAALHKSSGIACK